mmetsp:Transcript_7598/g.13406  ORF Transcript_7598/g.13406 Transcript_7598/m.13406 type:complete len:211 (-) Transcript_7598:90-722(-)
MRWHSSSSIKGSVHADETSILENFVAPPTSFPSKMLTGSSFVFASVAVAVVSVDSSFFADSPLEKMEDNAPEMNFPTPSSFCCFLPFLPLVISNSSSACSIATRCARNSRQSSPIMFSHDFSMRARSLFLELNRGAGAKGRCRDEDGGRGWHVDGGAARVSPTRREGANAVASSKRMRTKDIYFEMYGAMVASDLRRNDDVVRMRTAWIA